MKTTASYIRLLLLFVVAICLIEWVYDKGDEWAMFTEPMYWLIIGVLMLFALAFEISATALNSVLYRSLSEEKKLVYDTKLRTSEENRFKWVTESYKKLLGQKSIESEHEIELDHNYDGIKELDNNLPPWWVYSFYATILFAIIYMLRFEVFNEYNQIDEYENAVAQAKIEVEEWKKTAKDLIDANTVELLTSAEDLSAGKAIYTTNCVACHKDNGGGGIGPNLTDDSWILGGGIKNVFHTISEGGRSGKGMIAWKSDLKPSEMAQVASYVISLHGTNPADGKEPEGEIWVDENAPAAEANAQENDASETEETIENDTESESSDVAEESAE
ncbi:cbb3-type cytochrome c oxidase N-terminal domain-containing protein [Mesonia sp.]|uniref:cbb3-type cytochrome c oxidase N-terminal domain-containing protein n=2 Tax=Mesonia sp. TaxID=1960830 RepID=UPI003F94CCB6